MTSFAVAGGTVLAAISAVTMLATPSMVSAAGGAVGASVTVIAGGWGRK
ncbi:MAG: hypothetical protein AB7H88_14875 [Vicinamibacterales bacterium]